ncbi:hypothetical protein BCR44DRAFT_41319 [Catenaria anguillulae PL171]|uniref:Uncharacterized protein n=1 Tax=Catenaria anguillulae PL171 TaxID=765915 RepID=A0A1Y2HQ39_9FUNG|nr:hypothetical protein BCR44DRAFT_41319 [Catenaria anguillulae PL171]
MASRVSRVAAAFRHGNVSGQPSVHHGLARVPLFVSIFPYAGFPRHLQYHFPAPPNESTRRGLTTISKDNEPNQIHSTKTTRQPSASPATNAIPEEAMAWFKQHNHKPRSSDLNREFLKVLANLGLNGPADGLTGEQILQRKRLKAEFSKAAAINFAKKSKRLVFLQKLCKRYDVKIGATQDECIEQLDKLYVNIHDAVLTDGNKKTFESLEAFLDDVKRRTFSKESAKELGLRVFLKHVWE